MSSWAWSLGVTTRSSSMYFPVRAAASSDRASHTSERAAIAHSWHGDRLGMSSDVAAGVIECEEAVASLRAGDDRDALANALVLCATVLVRAHAFERSLGLLHEAHALLEPAGHGWLLAAHDLIVAWNLASLGRLEDAEFAARSSLERFDAEERSCWWCLR